MIYQEGIVWIQVLSWIIPPLVGAIVPILLAKLGYKWRWIPVDGKKKYLVDSDAMELNEYYYFELKKPRIKIKSEIRKLKIIKHRDAWLHDWSINDGNVKPDVRVKIRDGHLVLKLNKIVEGILVITTKRKFSIDDEDLLDIDSRGFYDPADGHWCLQTSISPRPSSEFHDKRVVIKNFCFYLPSELIIGLRNLDPDRQDIRGLVGVTLMYDIWKCLRITTDEGVFTSYEQLDYHVYTAESNLYLNLELQLKEFLLSDLMQFTIQIPTLGKGYLQEMRSYLQGTRKLNTISKLQKYCEDLCNEHNII